MKNQLGPKMDQKCYKKVFGTKNSQQLSDGTELMKN